MRIPPREQRAAAHLAGGEEVRINISAVIARIPVFTATALHCTTRSIQSTCGDVHIDFGSLQLRAERGLDVNALPRVDEWR